MAVKQWTQADSQGLAGLLGIQGVEFDQGTEQDKKVAAKFGNRMWDLSDVNNIFDRQDAGWDDLNNKWYDGFHENFDNPFIQGENFVTEHYVSDRSLAEKLRDAKVGDPIPTDARADFLTPLISKSGLTTVTPELQKLGEQFVFAGDAGYVKDAPAGNSGWLKQNAAAVGGTLGGLFFGPPGAALGSSLGTASQGGDFGDVIKAGALGYAGGVAGDYAKGLLNNAPEGSFLGDIAGGIDSTGNFLDPVIPDFIKTPGASIVGNGTSLGDFTAPDFNSLPTPDLSISPSLSDALANVSPTFNIPSVPVLPGVTGGTIGASPTPTAPTFDVSFDSLADNLNLSPTGTSGGFVSDAIDTVKNNSLSDNLSLASTALKLGGVGAGLLGAANAGEAAGPVEQQAIFPANTFSETAPNAEYRNSTGSSGAVTLPKLVYDQASPFRKSLMQSAIDNGKLIISGQP